MAKNSLFHSENWLWRPFGYIADVFLLSCMWFLCSVPLVTLGASTTALYDCAARCVRGKDQKMFARFFRTFKREFVTSTMSLAVWAAVIAGLYMLVKTYGNTAQVTDASVVVTVALLVIVVAVVGVACWVLPLLSRFTFGFAQLNGTAVKLALANLPRTMILGISTVVAAWLCLQLWIPFFFLPALLALEWTLFIEPVFKKYMEEE